MLRDFATLAPGVMPLTKPAYSAGPLRVVRLETSAHAITETMTRCAGSCPAVMTCAGEPKCSRCCLSGLSILARPQRGPCDPAAFPPLR